MYTKLTHLIRDFNNLAVAPTDKEKLNCLRLILDHCLECEEYRVEAIHNLKARRTFLTELTELNNQDDNRYATFVEDVSTSVKHNVLK